MKPFIISLFATLFFFGNLFAQAPGVEESFYNSFQAASFTDARDGQAYKTVALGDKIWMAQNLNVDLDSGSWFYDDDPNNGESYGRLYSWEAAQSACPLGWRLPSDHEWKELALAFGGYLEGETKEDVGDPIPTYQSLTQLDKDNFSAVLGGGRRIDRDYPYYHINTDGFYWTSTEYNATRAYRYDFDRNLQKLDRDHQPKTRGYSCRCLKDSLVVEQQTLTLEEREVEEEQWRLEQEEQHRIAEAQKKQQSRRTLAVGIVLLAICLVWLGRYLKRRKSAKVSFERQSTLIGYIGKMGGILILGITIALWTFLQVGHLIVFEGQYQDLPPLLQTLIAALAAGTLSALVYILTRVGKKVYLNSKKHFTISAQRKLEKDTRPPVVYLRSFQDDDEERSDIFTNEKHQQGLPFLPSLSTNEELLEIAMEKIGPFIAIGRPAETLPTLGASRMYLPDDSWQEEVKDLIAKASLVILRAGNSDGLWWELRQAFKWVNPERLVLLVPFSINNAFYQRLQEEFNISIAPPVEDKAEEQPKGISFTEYFVFFKSDWTPLAVPLHPIPFKYGSPTSLDVAYWLTIKPVVERLGLKWKMPPTGCVYTTMIILVVVIVTLVFSQILSAC